MSTTTLALARGTSVARGIGFALLGYASFSTGDALVKLASARFSVFQIAATLALFALIPVLALTRGRGGWRALVPNDWRLVALRAGLTAACALLAWRAFTILPLADGYALLFAAPILVTGLSVVILREAVGWRRWTAAGIGFLGVVIVIRPDFESLGAGHLLAGLAALAGAASFVTLKRIGASETSAAVLFATFLAMFVTSAPMVPANFVVPTWPELGSMALIGLLMGCGQASLVMATREAPAVVVAPFQYTQMLWAVAFGAFLFGDRPTPLLFMGMAVVVASGLYTVWRETIRRSTVTLGGGRGEVPARVAR